MSVVVKTGVSKQSELYECLMQQSDSEVVIIIKEKMIKKIFLSTFKNIK